jgi:hypothetical protein
MGDLIPLHSDIPFEPWHKDVEVLARLWTFLQVIDQQPKSVAHFLRHAEEWSDQYTALLECEYPALRGF